jgi:hypothetical protein
MNFSCSLDGWILSRSGETSPSVLLGIPSRCGMKNRTDDDRMVVRLYLNYIGLVRSRWMDLRIDQESAVLRSFRGSFLGWNGTPDG